MSATKPITETDLDPYVDFSEGNLQRVYRAELVEAGGDGRTLETRIVPYNTPAVVRDAWSPRPYQEMFLPGAFERQLNAADRVKVWLNFEHQQGISGIVGHGVELAERADGLHGSFRVHDNPDGQKALQLVHEGLLTGISLECAALRSRRVDGVVQRVRAHLDKVALCRFPAYPDALVLAVREAPEPDEPDEPPEPKPEPPAPTPARGDIDELLQRIGVEPLLIRAITRKPWDGSPARFTDEQYQRSTLFCRAGDDPPKTRCSLPVLEPNGDLNANALGAAAAALAGARSALANVSREQRAAAARKLIRYYGQAGMEPPASLTALARS